MDEKQIKEKIKLAESSVSVLKDQSLKEKAFEIILSSLLHGTTVSDTGRKSIRKVSAPRIKRQQGKEPKVTQLKFSETELEDLKKFYDKFIPSGSELCVFILANFLRVTLKKEEFHEGDVEYCYQQLLSLDTKSHPPAMNIDQIKRALSWLVAPTRKKLWLEVDEKSLYKVSPRGMMKFKDLDAGQKGKENETKGQ